MRPMQHIFARRDVLIRVLIFLIACLIGPAAFAATADDIGAAQSTHPRPEEAFARDDGATAHSFASPTLQSFFRNPDGFMSMVRNGYAPVYRHRSFVFGEARIVDGKILQEVQIIDADGVAWDALYTLDTQADGSLKISACILKKAVISSISPSALSGVASRVRAERIRQIAPERSRSQDPENAIENTTVFKETRSFAETVFGSTGWLSDFISDVKSRNDPFAAR